MRLTCHVLNVAMALAVLAGCGAGGPGGGSAGNRAPSLSLPATITINEDVFGAVLALQGSDPDGDALTYSVTTGPGIGSRLVE